MSKTSILPSINFFIIGALALVWNSIGVVAYLSKAFMGEETLSALSKAEQYYFSNMPIWVTAVFATAVFSGVFGSIAMLFKKKIANLLYLFSMISLLAHQVYNFFIQDYISVSGVGLIVPISTTAIGFFLLYYSYKMSKQGVLS